MKRILPIVFVIFTFYNSEGQVIVKSFKAQNWSMAVVTSMTPTLDGGLAIAGNLSDTFPSWHFELFLMKLDSSYNIEWAKQYDSGQPFDHVRKIDLSRDSGFLLICDYTTNLFDPYGFAITKTDSKGNFLWEKIYPGLEDDVYSRTSDGGYILGGETSGPGHTVMGLTKIDSAFNLQWSYAYAAADSLYSNALSIKETADHGFITTGELLSLSDKYDAIFLLKVDSLGIPIWSKSYSGPLYDEATEIILNTDSGFTIGGNASATIDSIGDIDTGELLMKTDKDGNMLWGKIYGENFIWIGHLEKSVDNGYYAYAHLTVSKTDSLGNLQWTKSYFPDPSTSASDEIYAYYQPDTSNFILCGAIGVVENEGAFFMKTTSQSDSCTLWLNNIATYKYNPTVDSIFFTLTPQYGQDTVVSVSSDLVFTDSVLCTNGVYTSVQNIEKPVNANAGIKLYPNPAGNQLIIDDSRFTIESIAIYNVLGVCCLKSEIENPKSEMTMDVSDLSSGVYFVRVSDETQSFVSKFVKE